MSDPDIPEPSASEPDAIQAEFAELRASEDDHGDEPAEPMSEELELVQEARVVEELLEDELEGRE